MADDIVISVAAEPSPATSSVVMKRVFLVLNAEDMACADRWPLLFQVAADMAPTYDVQLMLWRAHCPKSALLADVAMPEVWPWHLFPTHATVHVTAANARCASSVVVAADSDVQTLLHANEIAALHASMAAACERGIAAFASARASDVAPDVARAHVRARKMALVDAKPWCTWAQFVELAGDERVARAMLTLDVVRALPSTSAPAFAVVDLAWLLNLLQHIRVPRAYPVHWYDYDYAWSLLCVDRMVHRAVLDTMWPAECVGGGPETLQHMRDALAQHFECVGALGPRVTLAGVPVGRCDSVELASAAWVVPHLIWCSALPWEQLCAELGGVDGWRTPEPVAHCLRRRFACPTDTPHEVFRAVVKRLARATRCTVSISLGWIMVKAVDDDEVVALMVRTADNRADPVTRAAVLDVMAWYPRTRARSCLAFAAYAEVTDAVQRACDEVWKGGVHGVSMAWDSVTGTCTAAGSAPAATETAVAPADQVCEDAAFAGMWPHPLANVMVTWRALIPWSDIVDATLLTAGTDADAGLASLPLQHWAQESVRARMTGTRARVWRATWGDAAVAVKVFTPDNAYRSGATMQLDLRHENIVRVLGVCTQPIAVVYDLQTLRGVPQTLRAFVETAEYAEMHRSDDTLFDLATQMCAAIAYMHAKGVLHADVKPTNIFMSSSAAGRLQAKLGDFGSASYGDDDVCAGDAHAPLRCVFKHAVGTRGYVAPEQLFPERARVGACGETETEYVVSSASDVWGFGIVLQHLFCGSNNAMSAALYEDNALTTAKTDTVLGSAAEKLRTSLLGAAMCRKRQPTTPLEFTLVEWCLRARPQERPTAAHLLCVLETARRLLGEYVIAETDGEPAGSCAGDDDTDTGACDMDAVDVDAAPQPWDDVWNAAVMQHQNGDRRSRDFCVCTVPATVVASQLASMSAGTAVDDALLQLLDAGSTGVLTKAELRLRIGDCASVADVMRKARCAPFVAPPQPEAAFVGGDVVEEALTRVFAAAKELTDESQRVFAITGDSGCGKSRAALELTYRARDVAPEAFAGGIVFASVEDVELTAFTLYYTLCQAAGLCNMRNEQLCVAFQRWCARQCVGDKCVLLVVDAGAADVDEVAALLEPCLFTGCEVTLDADDDVPTNAVRGRLGRVLCVIVGSAKRDGLQHASATLAPQIVMTLKGLPRLLQAVLWCDDAGVAPHRDVNKCFVATLWDTLPPAARVVLVHLSAVHAPFDMAMALRLCRACVADGGAPLAARDVQDAMEMLQARHLLKRVDAKGWIVPAFVRSALPCSAAEMEAAAVAFVNCYSRVLCQCVEDMERAQATSSAADRFDTHRLAISQLLELASNVMTQPASVQRALLQLLTCDFAVMTLIEARMPSWTVVPVFSALWLCCWLRPRTRANARMLGVGSTHLARALYVADFNTDSAVAAEFSLQLLQLTARQHVPDHVLEASETALLESELRRDAKDVVNALSCLAAVLAEDRRVTNELPADVQVAYDCLAARAAVQMEVLRARFSCDHLKALTVTDVVFDLPGAWRCTQAAAATDMSERTASVPAVVDDVRRTVTSLVFVPRGAQAMTRALLLYCQAHVIAQLYGVANSSGPIWYNVANMLSDANRKHAAAALYQRVLAVDTAAFGPQHATVARTLSSLASVVFDLGKHVDAMALYEECLALRQHLFGAAHLDVARTQSYMGIVRHAMARYGEAYDLFGRCLRVRTFCLGAHPEVVSTLRNLAIVRAKRESTPTCGPLYARQLRDLRRMYECCIAISQHVYCAVHPVTALALDNLATVRFKEAHATEAVELFQRARAMWKRLGKDADVAECNKKLGAVLLSTENCDYHAALNHLLDSTTHAKTAAEACNIVLLQLMPDRTLDNVTADLTEKILELAERALSLHAQDAGVCVMALFLLDDLRGRGHYADPVAMENNIRHMLPALREGRVATHAKLLTRLLARYGCVNAELAWRVSAYLAQMAPTTLAPFNAKGEVLEACAAVLKAHEHDADVAQHVHALKCVLTGDGGAVDVKSVCD